jgi:hypothetical protein
MRDDPDEVLEHPVAIVNEVGNAEPRPMLGLFVTSTAEAKVRRVDPRRVGPRTASKPAKPPLCSNPPSQPFWVLQPVPRWTGISRLIRRMMPARRA